MTLKIERPKRGELTEGAKAYYREMFKRELTTTELRLMPFIQYTVMNEGTFAGNKVNKEEMQVITDLISMRYIVCRRVPSRPGMYRLAVTDKYWQGMCTVLSLTYVWRAYEDA